MTKARNAIIGTGAKITLHQFLQPIFKICAPFCSYFNFRKCCLKFDAVEAVAYLDTFLSSFWGNSRLVEVSYIIVRLLATDLRIKKSGVYVFLQ